MSFHIPAEVFRAPTAPERDVSAVPAGASVVATFGAAKNLARLAELPNLRHLWISGLPEKQLPLISSLEGLLSLVIHDLRTASLSGFRGLRRLERLGICGTSRLKSLEGVGALEQLHELFLDGVTTIQDLEPLSSALGLTTLCVEGSFSKDLHIPTLRPLASLRSLSRLRLASLRVTDRSLRPLHGLSALRDLFIADVFPPREFRDLGAALPYASGEWLDSHRSSAV